MAITLINITRNRDNYTFIYSNGFEVTVNLSHENLADRSKSNLQLFKSPQTGKNIKRSAIKTSKTKRNKSFSQGENFP